MFQKHFWAVVVLKKKRHLSFKETVIFFFNTMTWSSKKNFADDLQNPSLINIELWKIHSKYKMWKYLKNNNMHFFTTLAKQLLLKTNTDKQAE